LAWTLIGHTFGFLFLFTGFTAFADNTRFTLPQTEISSDTLQEYRQTGESKQKIYSGKKNTKVDIDENGPVATNNYRQVATRIPGLTIAEVANESWASITYRGLGDPHESFNLLVLEDDIPISADVYGYPAAYYNPPMDFVRQLEFVRGGASLLFGPQAGGALNYLTREPSGKPISGSFRGLGGSFGYAQTYAEVSGSHKQFSYLLSGHGRRSDGFRDTNGGYQIHGGNVKLAYRLNDRLNLRFKSTSYSGTHDEPGGLSKERGSGLQSAKDSWTATTSPNDKIEIHREFLGFGVDFSPTTKSSWAFDIWTSELRRHSFRQDYASSLTPRFGGVKDGTTNQIVQQKFETLGARLKGRSELDLQQKKLIWTYGYQFYNNLNPLEDFTGNTPTARSGTRELLVERESQSHAMFTEASLTVDKLTIVPGLRYENLIQAVDEKFRSSSGPLREEAIENEILLYGLGIEYQLPSKFWKLIANSSSGFTPPLFAEAFPLDPAVNINGDLGASRITNHEAGLVGQFSKTGFVEVTGFFLENSDQIGQVGNTFQNVGKAQYYGVEGLIVLDLFKEIWNRADSLKTTLGYSYLEAEFIEGDLKGRTPQYAPGHTLRWAFSYLHPSELLLTLSGQLLSRQFGNDNNSSAFEIPSFSVWDLSAQIPLGAEGLVAEIMFNNLFDEEYFARVRATGIEPGQPRFLSAGLRYQF
jgi:Fe(3+) dicitrate transport protein